MATTNAFGGRDPYELPRAELERGMAQLRMEIAELQRYHDKLAKELERRANPEVWRWGFSYGSADGKAVVYLTWREAAEAYAKHYRTDTESAYYSVRRMFLSPEEVERLGNKSGDSA